MGYIDKFLRLRCAGDVLESIQPVGGDMESRICEAMAVIDAIRPLTLHEPNKWKVLDISAGSPIAGVIAAHLLPVEAVKALIWRHSEKLQALQRVSHLRIDACDPHASWEKTWQETANGHTIVVATRPNFAGAMSIAANACERALPMAMVPARVRSKARGSEHVTMSRANLRWFAESRDQHLLYLGRLASLAGGEFDYLPYALPGHNDGIVTRGLSLIKSKKNPGVG